ncbi:MAG: hypothetical protein V4509_03730 [Patescibacteria group bacterium]
MASPENVTNQIPQGLDREGMEYNLDDIAEVETSQGSVYRYLPDGRTQRHKKIEDKDFEPQSLMIYIPDFDFIRAKPEWVSLVERFKDDAVLYEQTLLKTTHGEGQIVIMDLGATPPKILQTNKEIREGKRVSLVCTFKDGTPTLKIPISHKPLAGFMTYDERTFTGDDGQSLRENHIGNKVTRIGLKEKE